MLHVRSITHGQVWRIGVSEIPGHYCTEDPADDQLGDAEVQDVHHIQRQALDRESADVKKLADEVHAMISVGIKKTEIDGALEIVHQMQISHNTVLKQPSSRG